MPPKNIIFSPDTSSTPPGEISGLSPAPVFEVPTSTQVAFCPLPGGATFSRRAPEYTEGDDFDEDYTETEIPCTLLPMALILYHWAAAIRREEVPPLLAQDSTEHIREALLGAHFCTRKLSAWLHIDITQMAANTFRLNHEMRMHRAWTVQWLSSRLLATQWVEARWLTRTWLERGRWECILGEINDINAMLDVPARLPAEWPMDVTSPVEEPEAPPSWETTLRPSAEGNTMAEVEDIAHETLETQGMSLDDGPQDWSDFSDSSDDSDFDMG